MNLIPNNQSIEKVTPKNNDGLQLNVIEVDPAYRKYWNMDLHDFLCLTKNGELLRNTLYRKGGMWSESDFKKDYFMLLKHVEALYDVSITEDPNRRRHLESQWCIIDKDGNEKVNFKAFANPYLVKDSCIYSLDRKYFNIETGEFYCSAYSALQSKDFLFLEIGWSTGEARSGVLKINKKDGTYELFKQ